MQETIIAFLRKNGARLLILGLFFYVATRKQVRFHINLSQPEVALEATREVPLAEEQPASPPLRSEATTTPKAASLFDRFQFSLFQRDKKPQPSPSDYQPTRQKSSLNPQAQDAFIRRFAHVAIAERKKFGVPASLILANGLLQSQAGYDPRVRRGNNYFGLPCTPDWRGATITIEGVCYRAYETAWMSFRDHSIFLAKGSYAPGVSLLDTDYEEWIRHLIDHGYPASEAYADRMIALIEDLQLFVIDQQEE